jgi:hypothetical protein
MVRVMAFAISAMGFGSDVGLVLQGQLLELLLFSARFLTKGYYGLASMDSQAIPFKWRGESYTG